MKRWMKRAPFFILFAVAGAFAMGAIVMVLWNNVMPAVFHTGSITLLQAAGLLVLARLLFGGMRRGGGRHWGNRRDMAGWRGANRRGHATETSGRYQYTASWQMRYNPESAL